MQPALAVALIFGVFSVAVYNPLASLEGEVRTHADQLFNVRKSFAATRGTGSWLRQEGLDGPTVLRAKTAANRGLTLGGVTLLQFDLNNRFYEQVQANKAELRQGYWRLENAVAQAAGEAPRHYDEYFVSTYSSPAQVMDSIGSIETISFGSCRTLLVLQKGRNTGYTLRFAISAFFGAPYSYGRDGADRCNQLVETLPFWQNSNYGSGGVRRGICFLPLFGVFSEGRRFGFGTGYGRGMVPGVRSAPSFGYSSLISRGWLDCLRGRGGTALSEMGGCRDKSAHA